MEEQIEIDNIGSIYKITNLINNKVYIGQTKQNYIDRFTQHKSHARNHKNNHKLANALRKYGDENFKVELIEKCPYDKLDERERYWIKQYNSIKEGYNIQSGGQLSHTYYELDNQEEIIKYYYNCHNQIKTCEYFGITNYKLRQLLTKNNLPTDHTDYGKHNRKKVKIVELNKEFNSERECAQYFIDNNICQTKKLQSVIVRVNHVIRNNKKYYGYTIIIV